MTDSRIVLELVEEGLAIENAQLRERIASLELDVEAHRAVTQAARAYVAGIENDRLRDLRRENAALRALLMMHDTDVAA
jgi:hypothetical protein